MAAVSGRSSPVNMCADAPPNNARARSVRNQRASAVAGSSARGPNRAMRIGCRGRWMMGRKKSSVS